MKLTRRHFLIQSTLSALALVGASLGGMLTPEWLSAATKAKGPPPVGPLPAGAKEVAESDPVATAMGYHKVAAQTDFKRYPKRKKPENASQYCNNCALYKAENDGWGHCQLLTSGLVAAGGWCGSYSPVKGKT
jgi:hypothetical protein